MSPAQQATEFPRSPYALIRKTALTLQRHERLTLFCIVLPPLGALCGLWWIERLPAELVAAAMIAFGLFTLRLSAISAAEPVAASRIDRTLAAKDVFLTLATCERTEPQPLRSLVEAEAESRGTNVEARRFVGPIRGAPLARSLLYSALGFLLLAMAPAELRPLTASESRLVAIARELESRSDLHDQALGENLHDVLHILRDRTLREMEKATKVREVLAKLESEGGEAQGASGKGTKQGSETAKQGEKGGAENGPNGQGLRGQAQKELEEIANSLTRSSTSEGSSEPSENGKSSDHEKKRKEGGGIQGPGGKPGTKERSDRGDGNRPGEPPLEGKQPGESLQPTTGGREHRGAGERPSQGRSPDLSGTGNSQGGGEQPLADSNSPAAERFYKPGDGRQSPRIANGRYVRVRVPEESPGKGATEVVQKPGNTAPETSYGNAPLPGPGSPGEVREMQPLPLEYRDVLGSRS